MPIRSWVCRECGHTEETMGRSHEIPLCCDGPMRRNWRDEGVISNFHVTRDLFKEKKLRDAKRSGT